jgi:hypothetical protein
VGGGDHAHIGLDAAGGRQRGRTGRPTARAAGGSAVERHVADLVEKQGAAIGLLEAAAAHGLGAGEGTALVAEELALQQVLRGLPQC